MIFDIDGMDLASMQTLRQSYRRMRWFVAGVTSLGILTSMLLNVLHAPSRWDMQLVGALAPLAVFLSIEMVSRIPVTGKLLGIGRILASLAVGAGAGFISYLQQVDYLIKGGYESTIAHIFPGIIDGLTVVATLSLVEVTRVLRKLSVAIGKSTASVVTPSLTDAPAVAPVEPPTPAPVVEDAPAVTTAEDVPQPPKPVRRPRRRAGGGLGGYPGATDVEVSATLERISESAMNGAGSRGSTSESTSV